MGVRDTGPHIGLQNAWPMSLLIQAQTSNDDAEIMECLNLVLKSSQLGLVHESIHVDYIHAYTRKSWLVRDGHMSWLADSEAGGCRKLVCLGERGLCRSHIGSGAAETASDIQGFGTVCIVGRALGNERGMIMSYSVTCVLKKQAPVTSESIRDTNDKSSHYPHSENLNWSASTRKYPHPAVGSWGIGCGGEHPEPPDEPRISQRPAGNVGISAKVHQARHPALSCGFGPVEGKGVTRRRKKCDCY